MIMWTCESCETCDLCNQVCTSQLHSCFLGPAKSHLDLAHDSNLYININDVMHVDCIHGQHCHIIVALLSSHANSRFLI